MKRKVKTSGKLTAEQRHRLVVRDILGELTPAEIKIAKANGLFKYDAMEKARKARFKSNNKTVIS